LLDSLLQETRYTAGKSLNDDHTGHLSFLWSNELIL